MKCREAERLVMPYIQDELTDGELEEFLEHVETCPSCQEELEIYFMVSLGLRQLDEGTGSFNMKQELEEILDLSYRRVHFVRTPFFFSSEYGWGKDGKAERILGLWLGTERKNDGKINVN